ncbi:MAG TPA: ring-cleaving dioxygenase [Rhodothermales bacterium]
MELSTPGIHHVTAIAGPPQRNVDFYVRDLGLRLVKRTVNFDDPGTYHFYYGDYHGTPGSILTFFPWPHAVRGSAGAGTVGDTAFAVPPGSLVYWTERLRAANCPFQGPFTHLGSPTIVFEDPDGLSLQLVEDPEATAASGQGTDGEHSIRGFFGVTLAVANRTRTVRLLTEVMGFEHVGEEQDVLRFRTKAPGMGRHVDIVTAANPARLGAGSVHHVAFRARDDDEQREWQEALTNAGLHVTDVRDRNYFRSIYFREPGGVLFEIATDAPGFAADEPLDQLGRDLKLPSWLETHRERIERQLPEITLPD